MRTLVTALCLLALSAGAASADVYQWTDDRGVVSFTDNADRIPTRYRKKARRVESSPVTTVPAETPVSAPAPARGTAPDDTATAPSTGRSTYGGQDEDGWRRSFAAARQRISTLETELAEKRKKQNEVARQRTIYQRSRDRVAYYGLKDEIEQGEKQLQAARQELADLEQRAAGAGVPGAWRQ